MEPVLPTNAVTPSLAKHDISSSAFFLISSLVKSCENPSKTPDKIPTAIFYFYSLLKPFPVFFNFSLL